MNVFCLVLLISVLLGAFSGGYCQLYYLIKHVVISWEILLTHAIAKRQALLSLSVSPAHTHSLEQEIAFLNQYHHLSWRTFLKESHTILFALREMEESQEHTVKEILDSLHGEKSICAIEEFWAQDNLFSFETSAYEQAVDKYVKNRTRPSLWLAAQCFRFLDLPIIQFHR